MAEDRQAQDPTSTLKTAAEMWASYRDEVLPKEAPPVQVRECQLAFYAGVAFMYDALTAGVADPQVEVEAGFNYLDALERELRQFADDATARGERRG